MKRFLWLLLISSAIGQVIVGNYNVSYVTIAPSGACSQNSNMQQVIGAGTLWSCQSGTWGQIGGSGGSVTSVSVTTANGVSGVVATATTTPAITLTLGAITPTSTNGVSAATMAFVDPTSSIQTQLNAKGVGTVTAVSGTANQVSVATGTTTPVLSIPNTFIAPGSIAATTTLSGTGLSISGASGAITFANGMTVTNLTGSPNSLQVAGGNINITSGGVTILSLNVAGLQATNGGYIYDTGIFYDSTTSAGTSGCPMTSTGSAVLWNCSPTLTTFKSATNCSNGASPAVCGSAPTGAVALPTGTNPTLVVNTTAVTANSRITLTVDESLTIASTTCNTTLSTLTNPVVTARTAGTSFTFTIGAVIAANPACVSYIIAN